MMTKLVNSYNNAPPNWSNDQKRKSQQKKLNLQNTIQNYLAKEYSKGNPKITHFYDKGYVNEAISKMLIHPDWEHRIERLKIYLDD